MDKQQIIIKINLNILFMLIISRTPFRISFFGGGTDFPEWFENNNGLTISTTINKYCNILVRYLPPFFDFKYRLRYYKTELVKNKNQIKHPTINKIIKKKDIIIFLIQKKPSFYIITKSFMKNQMR